MEIFRFFKLADIINIILYLWIGYMMVGDQIILKFQQFKKKNFKYLFFYCMFDVDLQGGFGYGYYLGIQVSGGCILIYVVIITRVGVREESVYI